MNNGYLSQYFDSVAVKRLSAVEANRNTSNQHEFNGTIPLKQVLRTTERTQFPTLFLWMEEENVALSVEDTVTWYDAREHHPTRSEYRLYFPTNEVTAMAREGDTMFIAKRTDGTVLIIITPSGSTIENQLYWLFGLDRPSGTGFELSEIDNGNDHELDFATRFILEELGIEVEEPENELLDRLLLPFNGNFPVTRDFSAFARSCIQERIDPTEDPDGTLLAFMEWEEKLFRRLERHIVSRRLQEGFVSHDGNQDVDGFINFSLSVQNRRKSRAGYALEDHLEYILNANQIRFSRAARTENRSKPDFLFPNVANYHDPHFPSDQLTMLGVKTSCKDRWRQVLAEANRIANKHLLTLEPGISQAQTDEMRSQRLQLVVPQGIHETYSGSQQSWLMSVRDFIVLADQRQSGIRLL